jgi:hypothetical protein
MTSPAMPHLSTETGEPQVTIIVSFRERWRFTPLIIETILRNTPAPFTLLLLDSGMPEQIRHALQPHVDANVLKIIDVGQGTQPNHARAGIIVRLTTPYAVFIDNDVTVASGWLDNLVTCAEETGAGIVSPLYLWGDHENSDLIHMAGGGITLNDEDNGVRFRESHRHVMKTIPEVATELRREICGFGEFHCLMMRREVYQAEGIFNPGIVTVHEHIHASLTARKLGFSTWFEPASRVTYLAFAPWLAGELEDFRNRWNHDLVEASMQAFAEHWDFIDDDTFRSGIRGFLVRHVGHIDLLDCRAQASERRNQIMTRADLQQTFSGLELMALQHGYTINEIEVLLKAYHIAMQLMNGLYRPCGRPFINHLAGTASVLLFYGCPIRVVVAGMLHATFSHGMGSKQNPQVDLAIEKAAGTLESTGKHAIAVARRYHVRKQIFENLSNDHASPAECTLGDAELYLLDAANDVDMHLSLEVAVTGRTDVLSGNPHLDCLELLRYIGLPGLVTTLAEVRENPVNLPTIGFGNNRLGSFALPDPARPS